MKREVKINIKIGERQSDLLVTAGANLRTSLLLAGFSPYQGVFKKLNCGGMGLCGSCLVGVRESSQLWDRRSCQIQCYQDIVIEIFE